MLVDQELDDATLEWAARAIEEASMLDISGIWAGSKRQREDADLRYQTRQEVRKEMARQLRAFKARADLSALSVLAELAALPDNGRGHVMHLTDAWPLAFKGWVNIYATTRCNDNCIPPETSYRIALTEKGHEVLQRGAP